MNIKGYQSGEAPPPPPTDLKVQAKPETPPKLEDVRKWEATLKEQKKKDDSGKSDTSGDQPALDPDPAKRVDMQALRTLTHEVAAELHPFHPLHPPSPKDGDAKPGEDPTKPAEIDPKEKDTPKEPGVGTSDLILVAPKPYFVVPMPLALLQYTNPARLTSTLADANKSSSNSVTGATEAQEGVQRGQLRNDFEKKELERDAAILGVGVLQQLNQAAPAPLVPELAQTPPVPSQELQERIERMAQRLLVTDPSSGQKPEIVLQLDSQYLHGSELALRMENNELVISLRTSDPKVLSSLEGVKGNLQNEVEQALTRGRPDLQVRVNLELRGNA